MSEKLNRFDLSMVNEKAGDVEIDVEYRKNMDEQFGKGKKKKIPFREFYETLKEQKLYMTTQRGDDDVINEPLKRFVPDVIPSHLDLAGNLKLSNLNMWCGYVEAAAENPSSKFTSTPLHADFHDNFYILLSGTKRFTLFSPDRAQDLQTVGTIERVFENGLINFEGCETNSDGSTKFAVAQKRLENAEIAGNEEEIENALEAILDLGEQEEALKEEGENNGDPYHFCKIPSKNALMFPHLEIELKEGESLYLPCGWFHEVKSFSSGKSAHLAVNFWYHVCDTQDFSDPYSTIAFK